MPHKIISVLLACVLAVGTVIALTGCNTVEGAGKDIEAGGQSIKDEANQHK